MIRLYSLLPKHVILENLESLAKIFNNNYPGIKIDVYDKGDNIYLSRIVVPKELRDKGIGTKFMIELCKHADSKGKIITLTPSVDFGGSSTTRLKKFYKRFGFVENKGRYKDFKISDTMYRMPK